MLFCSVVNCDRIMVVVQKTFFSRFFSFPLCFDEDVIATEKGAGGLEGDRATIKR